MIYQIKRTNGNVEWLLKEVKPTGTQSREAMGADVVDMAFTLPVYIDFRIGDFVDVYGQRYVINITPTVDKKAKRQFEYNIQFEASWYDLAKVQYQVLNPSNGCLEPVFDLTGNALTFIDLLVQNANRHSAGWSVGVVDDSDYTTLNFSTQNCLQVLHTLANEFKTEFWIENKTIHLQKREQSSGYTFEYGKGNGLYNIRRQNKSNANICTRLYVRGGSNNLPADYGSNSLLLPGGLTYIQDNAKVALYGLIEATQIFENIFPQREGTVTSVVAGDDNWKYFTDSAIDFDVNAQKAAGLDAKITFNTGQLAGYTFTINSYNHATKQFIINKNDAETALNIPSNVLRPQVGDKYVLIDIVMPQSYVTNEENKLSVNGWAYYNENSDPKFLLAYSATCDPLFIGQNNIAVTLGNTAVLSDADFAVNTELRISKYTRDLKNPDLYPSLEWSDTIGANEIIRQYQQQKKTLQMLESSGLLTPDQMRKNLFLNRLSAQDGYLMLSGQKVKAGLADFATDAAHASIADYAWDADKWDGRQFADYLNQPVRQTDAVKFASVVADTVNSTVYVSGFTGSGYRINPDGSAEFDSLTVRKELNINVLNVREITGSGGSVAITNVAKIKEVVDKGDYWACSINNDDGTIAVQLRANDIVRCQIWDGKKLKYYSARVIGVSSNIFDLDKTGKIGAGIPQAGDTVFQFGNTTDVNRQGLIYLTNSDTGAPYLDVLDGITSDNLAGKTKVRLGKLNGINDADLGALDGYGLYAERAFIKGKIVVTGGNAATTTNVATAKAEAITAATTQAQADATAKASAAQIAAIQAAANDASAKVLAVNIGGRNYQKNGGVTSAIGYVNANAISAFYVENINELRIKGTNQGYLYAPVLSSILALTDIITLSLYVKNNGAIAHNLRMSLNGHNSPFNINLLPNQGWTKQTVTCLISDMTFNPLNGVVLENYTSGNFDISVKQIKIELGNKATDWTPAPEDVANDAQAKADAAQTAATNAAYAQAAYEREIAKAYADGIVDAEETRAIADALNKLNEAKADATAKLNSAIAASNGYTDAQTQANLVLAQNYADSIATTKANAAQANAISQASTDAQNKATTAYNNAVSAANSYAATVANSAATQAEVNAAADALQKANNAYNNAVANATAQYNALTANLKSLAYLDVVELAKLGTTIIDGGKIKTTLLDADYIRANVVNAAYINTLSIDAAAIKSGTIDSARINAGQIISNGGGATVSYVNTSVNTATTQAQADATAKASAAQVAAIQVAANDATAKILAVNIGGRNYQKNSQILSVAGFNPIQHINSLYVENTNELRIKGVDAGYCYFPAISETLALSEVATFSCWVKNNVSDIVNISFTANGNNSILYYTLQSNQGWTKITGTASLGAIALAPVNVFMFEGYTATSFDISIKALKVEKGNKATDWTPAPEDVTNDAQAKADAAQSAATNAAYAQAAYEREIAKAYADGKVTAEEQARIAQAASNLQAAKDDATAKVNTAIATANGYTDTKALATISAAQTYADNTAQTKANAAQANAISQASTDAQNKANAAQNAAALLSQQLVDGIKVGGRNYQKNGGITSLNDYLNANAITEYYIENVNELRIKGGNQGYLWMPPLSSSLALTEIITISFFVKNNGAIAHNLRTSLNGHGSPFNINLTANQGWSKQTVTCLISDATFAPLSRVLIENYTSGSFDISIKQIKIELGTKATDWTPAPEDVQAAIDLAKATADTANANYAALTANLKSLAYQDVVELAKLGTTIIEGGKIKTTLLDADYIRANIVNAAYINTLEIVTKNLKTFATGKRVEIDSANNNIRILNDQSAVLIELDDDSAYEYTRLYFNGPPVGNTYTRFYGPGIRVGNETAARTTMGRYGFTVFDENNVIKHKIGTYSQSNVFLDREDVIFDIQNGFILKNVTASWDANNQYNTKQNIRVFAETISGDFGSAQVLTWTTV